MKKLLGLIVIMGFFAVSGILPFAFATITHSSLRDEEQRHGRTVKKHDSNEPAKDKAKAPEKPKVSENDKKADTAKEHQQQLKAIEGQIAGEKTKFAERKAQLERIKDSATKAGDTKKAQLADVTLEKEQQKYDQKQQQLEERRQKLLDLIKQDPPIDPNKPAK